MNILALLLLLQVQPEPDQVSRRQGEVDLKAQFKVEYARRLPGDVRTLADRLLASAVSGEIRDPGMRYAAFTEARNAFLRLSDIPAAYETAGKLASVFDVDVVAERGTLLSKASQGAQGDALSYVANLYFQLASQAADLDRYDEAIKFLSSSESSAALCKDIPLRDSATYWRGVFETFRLAFQKSKKSDVDMGRWLCFFRQDWKGGLSFLAGGTDQLSDVAKVELEGKTSVEDVVRLADLWWESAAKEKSVQVRDSCRAHSIAIFSSVNGAGDVWGARFADRRRIFGRDSLGDRLECVPGVSRRTKGVELAAAIGDGRCQIGYFNGRPAAKTGIAETGPCAYFSVSDLWVSAGAMVEVSVEYVDGTSILAMGITETKGVKSPDSIQMGGTGVWKVFLAKVPAEAFSNGIHGVDFRMVSTGKDPCIIGRVSIKKVQR